jgi:hypothetical protein
MNKRKVKSLWDLSPEQLILACEKGQFVIKGLNSSFPDTKMPLLEVHRNIFYFRMDCMSQILFATALFDFWGPRGLEKFLASPRHKQLWTLSGIYPQDKEVLTQFCAEYLRALRECTYIGCWTKDFVPEHYLSQKFCHGKELYSRTHVNGTYLNYHVGSLFWFNKDDWYEKLRNKKILVISGHSESMKKQWLSNNLFRAHKKNITYQDTNIEIQFVKPPFSGGGSTPHHSWIEGAQHLKNEVSKVAADFHFDVALVSCGGYAAPICNYIGIELGKSVFYLGGALQLYFCIKVKRWSRSQFYNDYWISVPPEEIPENHHQIEGGAYW